MKEMGHTNNESDDSVLSIDKIDSPLVDDGSSGGSLGGGTVLKKGPWTSAEDAILVDYVKEHGEGNWNAVQKHSGLFRCGKSCRLRWANHLRPNLKKGSFTSEEEQLIIELHAKMGNKWAQMAAHLPGRTDNEIKNYWNTRIKRRQRAGLPLYPPDVCLQALNNSQQSQNSGEFNGGDARHNNVMQGNNYEIPDVIFDNLKANPGVLSYASSLPVISASNMLRQTLCSSQNYSFISPTVHRSKRLRESETLFPGFNGSVTTVLPQYDHFQNDSCKRIHQSFGLSFPYDPDPNSKNLLQVGILPGTHALLNGNFSASKPVSGSLKLELPSLQYSESDLGSWATSPAPPPSLESVDTFIQSSSNEPVQSDCLSRRNSGLLDALLHEAETLSSGKSHSSEKSSSSSVVMPSEMLYGSDLILCGTELEEHSDPISPLGQSAASVFSECTPISASSWEDAPLPDVIPGSDVKPDVVEHVPNSGRRKKENSIPVGLFQDRWFTWFKLV